LGATGVADAGAGVGAGAGAGPGRGAGGRGGFLHSSLFNQPPNLFSPNPGNPGASELKKIFYDTNITPEGKNRYLPGVS